MVLAFAIAAALSADPEALSAQAAQEKDSDRAVELAEKAVALAPQVARYHDQLGDLYCGKAQDASIFTKLSWARKCRAQYEHAVELEPGSAKWRDDLMQFYLHVPGIAGGGVDKARAQAKEIAKLDVFLGYMAEANIALNEKEEAMPPLRLALEAARTDVQRARAHRGLGIAHQVAGRKAEAAAEYRKSLELEPAGERAEKTRARLKELE